MAAKLEKTRTPGIFKRGSRYVFSYRDDQGKQRWESCRTLEEARRAKAARSTDIARGEFEQRSRVTLRAYAEDWIERYLGRRKGGFRDATRDEYRRQLQQYIYPFFGDKITLREIRPKRVSQFVAWLMDEEKQGERDAEERHRKALERRQAKADAKGVDPDTLPLPVKPEDPTLRLSDETIKKIMAPLKACLATARKEGEVSANAASETDLPDRETDDELEEEQEEQVKAMSTSELATMLALIPDNHRLFFQVLAATGLRISEARALQWRHMHLDGSDPHVKVRRALVKGHMGKPKSKYGKREIPLHHDMVIALRRHHKDSEWPGQKDIVFPSLTGTPLDPGNLYNRTLKPAAEEADVAWIGFHTFRHTCATRLFAAGRNVKQVQRWLGHHSATFTLETYIGLLDEDKGEPLALPQSANKVQTCPTPLHTTSPNEGKGDLASQSQISDSATLQKAA
jgi:integrase